MGDGDLIPATPSVEVADANPYADAIAAQKPPAPPTPDAPPEVNPYSDAIEQQAGAQRALLASSLAGAAETKPEHQSKVVALADKLGLASEIVEKNYDAISAQVQLQDRDYNRLLQHHPEVASWLTIPENAAIAHDEVPQIQQMDLMAKTLSGIPHDITGILPDGFMFKKDGTIRGPLHADGTPPVIYKGLDQVRQLFQRESAQGALEQRIADAQAAASEAWLKETWFPSLGAGAEGSVLSTEAAISRLTGGRFTFEGGLDGEGLDRAAQGILGGAERLNPGLGGSTARIAGQLIGDAPLYLLGGEVAGLSDLAKGIKAIKAATALPLVPKSEYLADVWKTALAYSPVAARSGINTGAEHGAAYGSLDFLINALGPASIGSKLGLAKAIVPRGTEATAAASAGWTGVAGRLMVHAGSQGGIMAATELANAIHEYASGVDPDALNASALLPRLGQAGAMGGILASAFHLPGAIGDLTYRRQVAAHAAMVHADALGAFMESTEALQAAQRSPQRFEDLVKATIPDDQRTKFFQSEDFEGVAKSANMAPEELATQMGIGDEYKRALATGQMMTVPTHLLLKWGMEHEDPLVKKALLTAARSSAVGINANEALKFYEETPDQLAKHKLDLETDVAKAARELPESDRIYQDILAKYEEAGQIPDAARANAKLMAAAENTMAARHNADVEASGKGTLVDAFDEYQSRLKAVKRGDQAHPVEAFDALLDRVRDNNVPTERQAYGKSLVEFLEKRGVKDPTGELAKAGAEKIIDEHGHDLDVAAERAHDEGYIEDAEPATLIDALKREFAGRSVFSAQNRNEELHQLRTAAVGLAQHMAAKGIDPSRSNDEIKSALTGDPMMARMSQPGDEGARGSLEWDAARHFTMTLNGNADLSTVAHEAAHYWFERMGDYAMREDASPQIRADYEKMLEFTGYGTHETKLAKMQEAADLQARLMREGRAPTAAEQKRLDALAAPHEKFARAVEQYLMEGHAPSPELRPVLQRFAIWLTAIYKNVKDLVTLTPEVRAVFDRLLATDDAITQVQQDLGTSTIFKDQAASGMDDASWGKYLKSVQRERERSQANVFAKAMKTLRAENTRAYNREVDKAKIAATSIVRARPVNIAVGEMVHRVDAHGNEISEVPKLSRELIVKEYGSIARLPRGITQVEGGLSLEVAAEHYGFQSAEEMWTALANYTKPHEQIRELSEQIVKAQHPELSPEALHQAAMEAVHANNSHADVLSQESAALAIHALKKPIPQEQMKAIAERMVDETNHQDVNPEAHLRAEQRASDASTKAFLEVPPDYTAAFLHKQRQELSHALYRASMEAQGVIDDCAKLMKRMRKVDALSVLGHAGGFVITGKNGERLITVDPAEAQALAKEYDGTVENYLQAMTRMLEVWNDKPTRFDMEYGAVHDFYREAAAIQHQAKQAFDIITGDRKEKLADVLRDLTSRQEETSKGKVVIVPRDKKGFAWLSKTWLRQFDAGNRTLAAIAMELDGGRPGGPHWEHIVRPLNDAANDEQIRRIQNSQEMTDLIKAWGKRGRKESVYVPAVGENLSLETRIGVALNAGTKPNLERMMTGDGWDRSQIAAIIMTLDKSDLELVKGIWAHLEKKWPEISALHQRLTGIPPAKKETLPIETAYGTMDGGYYPILYDKDVSARAFELTLDKPTNPTLGQPKAGFVENTVKTTGLRLQYGFSALFRHDSDTAHYLSHAEAAANLNKILNSPDFRENVVRRFGMETYKAMTERVRNVLEGPRGPQNAFERAVRFIRQRSGLATIGYSAMTVAVHGFGVPQSMHRVGAAEWMAAQGQLIASAGSLESGYAFIDSKSSFMRESRHNFTPEMDERISQGLPGGVLDQVRAHALDGLHMALRVINSATWMAEYKTRIAETTGDDARAVALADQAVRDTQGGGQTVDKTRYQDANEFSRVFMQYAIFFTRTYQMLRPGVTGVLDNPKSGQAYWASAKAFLVLVALPAAAESIFKQVVKPSPGDDRSAKFWAERLGKANLEYLLSTVMGGREIAGIIDGNQFGGPASARSVASMASAVGALRNLVNDPTASHAGKAGRSALAMAGLAFGIPSNQIDHIIQGILYDHEHGSLNPAPVLFGPPPKH